MIQPEGNFGTLEDLDMLEKTIPLPDQQRCHSVS